MDHIRWHRIEFFPQCHPLLRRSFFVGKTAKADENFERTKKFFDSCSVLKTDKKRPLEKSTRMEKIG